MARTIEASEGLAALGTGTFGPIALPVPSILWSPRPGAMTPDRNGSDPVLRTARDDRPGRRRLEIQLGGVSQPLDLPILAPEISGVPGHVEEAGDGIWSAHAPLGQSELARLRDARPQLIVLGNARTLLMEGEPFVRAIADLRAAVGSEPLLWAPRVALPHRLAFLAYLGVDLVDSTEVEWKTSERIAFDPTLGTLDPEPRSRRDQCPCPACQADPPGPLADHSAWVLSREMGLVRAAIRQGRARELVESRLSSEPLLAELLRYTDRHLYPLLEERHPVVGSGIRTYVLSESFRRPEVRRFRERFLARYRPPPSKEVLLLVPCSRTKPYRSSRSHRRLAAALEGIPARERVHVVSVTSPLGVVPRELEDVYPARHYDIPVTGTWSEEERESVISAVAHLRTSGNYRSLVVHLDPSEYGFLRPTIERSGGGSWTMTDDRTTSAESLSRLREGVVAAVEGGSGPVEGGPLATVREELQSIAGFQFGPEAAARLFQPPIRLAGRPWFQRLTDGGATDLATWREERGLFQLTVAGGRRMMPDPPLAVEVATGVTLTGDLFVPGVARADPAIRPGDAVTLVRDGELLGVGEASVGGPEMARLRRGLAVRVRHRSHSGTEARPAPSSIPLRQSNGPVV